MAIVKLAHTNAHCGCRSNRMQRILAARLRATQPASISKAEQMTVAAPHKLTLPADITNYLAPTQIVNGVFSINATLYMGSPGLLSGDGILAGNGIGDIFNLYNSFFDTFGTISTAGFQPAHTAVTSELSGGVGDYVVDNSYAAVNGLITSQSVFGQLVKTNTYNSDGFIVQSSQVCEDTTFMTYDFSYDAYNRLTKVVFTLPKACDVDTEQGYSVVFQYYYFEQESPFQPSYLQVTGSSDIVTPGNAKIDYYVADGRFQAINGVYTPSGGAMDYFSMDFTYDAEQTLTSLESYYDIFNSEANKVKFLYADGLYSGYEQKQSVESSTLSLSWDNQLLTEVKYAQVNAVTWTATLVYD